VFFGKARNGDTVLVRSCLGKYKEDQEGERKMKFTRGFRHSL
jgi:hypothetical protein